MTTSASPGDSHFERWFRDGERAEGDPIPAATVVLVRDRDGAVETIMLRKNSKLAFGGMWVFPGGRIDEVDYDADRDANVAAEREIHAVAGRRAV